MQYLYQPNLPKNVVIYTLIIYNYIFYAVIFHQTTNTGRLRNSRPDLVYIPLTQLATLAA